MRVWIGHRPSGRPVSRRSRVRDRARDLFTGRPFEGLYATDEIDDTVAHGEQTRATRLRLGQRLRLAQTLRDNVRCYDIAAVDFECGDRHAQQREPSRRAVTIDAHEAARLAVL